MFEIVFLGTSASAPSIQRGLSAQIVMHEEHRFIVDCGEGTQRQILRSGLGFRRLNKILLTHGHLDHILGLGGLISTFARWEAMERIQIWGGASTLNRVKDLLFGVVLRGPRPAVDIDLIEIEPGVLFDGGDFTVSAFPVKHRGPGCFGFTFKRKPHRPFLAERAEELGVPHGPERRELVEGNTITLNDGRTIEPEQVLGDAVTGDKLCITGDTAETSSLLPYVENADAIVSEATYMHYEVELARRFGHITAHEAAQLAHDAGATGLLLTHLSRRYRERDIAEEAQQNFPGAIVARDFDHFRIRHGEPLEKAEV